jgi:hypothetical protein
VTSRAPSTIRVSSAMAGSRPTSRVTKRRPPVWTAAHSAILASHFELATRCFD